MIAGTGFAQDIRYGLRVLRQNPGFATVAILSLALGIGANSAIFELVDAVRLRSLPVPNPGALAQIQIRGGNRGMGISDGLDQLTYPLFEEIGRHQQAFSGVFAWTEDTVRVGRGLRSHQARAQLVTGGYFQTLGIRPALGRLLSAADDRKGCAAPAVVLSYAFWQSEFGGDPAVIGRDLTVIDAHLPVVGVAPPSFTGLEVGSKFDLALPVCAQGVLNLGFDSLTRTDDYWLTAIGRLKPGWTIARASEHLRAISPGLIEATLPVGYTARAVEQYRRVRLEAIPGGTGISQLRTQYDSSLNLLLGITGLVLLLACANLANFLLARASAQQKEFAVRQALGASRLRLIRQCLAQSLLLALGGAALGLLLAQLISGGLVWFLSTKADPVQLDLRLDSHMFLFAGVVAVGASLLFGLAPALRVSQSRPGDAMQSGSRGLTAGRERLWLQRSFVVIQVSLSLALVAGALLFVRSFQNLMTLDPGFRTAHLFQVNINIDQAALAHNGPAPYRQPLLDDVRAMPGIEGAASTTNFQIHDGVWSLIVRAGERLSDSRFTWVSPGYFHLLGTPLLAGRDFNSADTETSPNVAVVNETFARRFFGNGPALGGTFQTQPEPDYPATLYRIVGVVKDTRYYDLRERPPAICYAPAAQYPPKGPWSEFYVRSRMSATALRTAIQQRIGPAHPEISIDLRSFQSAIDDSLVRERLLAVLSGVFGVLAGVLAAIGLYGLMAYVTARRTAEIGIRLALGARRGMIVSMMLKEAGLLLAAGAAAGLIGTMGLEKAAGSLLFGLQSRDPLTYVAAVALLTAAVGVGSYLPARRASRLDPMAAIRCE